MDKRFVNNAIMNSINGSMDKPVVSKATPVFPESADREMQRILLFYARKMKSTMKDQIKALFNYYRQEMENDSRFDDASRLSYKTRMELEKAQPEIDKLVDKYGLEKSLNKVAKLVSVHAFREWKRMIQASLKVTVSEEYYGKEFYEQVTKDWVKDNVAKIKTMPDYTLGEIEGIIYEGYQSGKDLKTLAKLISDKFNQTENYAKNLARDQISTLSGQITRLEQEDAGCKKYKWVSSQDARVRECHRSLHGQIIEWDNPPEMWYKTKSKGIVFTGRKCHPQEDFMCRCIALPIFDLKELDIPVKEYNNGSDINNANSEFLEKLAKMKQEKANRIKDEDLERMLYQ